MPVKVLNGGFLTPPTPPSKVMCQADVKVTGAWQEQTRAEWHKKGVRRYRGTERPSQCTFDAVVEVDGLPMCRRHAGQVVLEKFIKGELAEKEVGK